MLPTESSKKSDKKTSHVYLRIGLEGQDDAIEVLQGYFRQMQTMTVETSMDADIDLLTFALSAHYFGVIMMEEATERPEYLTNVWRGGDLPPEEDPEALPRDLDDDELAELNIPRPITEEEFLALSEGDKQIRWSKAWKAKKSGSLYDDSDFDMIEDDTAESQRNIEEPDDYYLSDEDEDDAADPSEDSDKGKMREPGVVTPWANRQPTDYPIPASVNDHLINWPEDIQSDAGPPSSDDDFHSISSDNMSEFPAMLPYDQFGYPLEPPVDPNFGREYFEPDTGPPVTLPPIPEDPIAKEVVREAALRKVDELRARTVHLYEKKKARLARRRIVEARNKANGQTGTQAPAGKSTMTAPQTTTALQMVTRATAKPIGLVYLTPSQNFWDPLHKGECNIGFYVAPEYRTLNRLSAALHRAIEDAFHEQDCHRLQAVLVDHPDILDFLNLYASAGFRQEGIRRRAFFSQITGEWKDVTYLAILATEWIHDHRNTSNAKLLPSSLWDEILSRHQREQEEFIRMEEEKLGTWPGHLKRSSSLETIREAVPTVDSGAETSGFSTDVSSSSFASSVSKRRNSSSIRLSAGPSSSRRGLFQSSSESGFESEWDMASAADADDVDFFSAGTYDSSIRFASRPSTWDML